MDIYEFVRGPLAIAAFAVLIGGIAYRLLSLLLVGKKVKMLYPAKSVNGGIRSIIHGLIPFGSMYMRKRPVFTIVTLLFHLSLIVLPFFLLAHIVLWFESYDIVWWSISNHLADTMTLFVLSSCIFFLGRRLFFKEVRQVSRTSDYVLLIMIFITFLTGFMAFHQYGPYRPVLILHILSGEILMVMIPFSRLMHMIYFSFSRAYMGAEYGGVLKPADW